MRKNERRGAGIKGVMNHALQGYINGQAGKIMNKRFAFLAMSVGGIFATSAACSADVVSDVMYTQSVYGTDPYSSAFYNQSISGTAYPFMQSLTLTTPAKATITANYNYSQSTTIATFDINSTGSLVSQGQGVDEDTESADNYNSYVYFTPLVPVEYSLSFISTNSSGSETSKFFQLNDGFLQVYSDSNNDGSPIVASGILNAGDNYNFFERWVFSTGQPHDATSGTGSDSFSLTLTAIPEPSSIMMLFGSALLLLKRPMRWTQVGLSNA